MKKILRDQWCNNFIPSRAILVLAFVLILGSTICAQTLTRKLTNRVDEDYVYLIRPSGNRWSGEVKDGKRLGLLGLKSSELGALAQNSGASQGQLLALQSIGIEDVQPIYTFSMELFRHPGFLLGFSKVPPESMLQRLESLVGDDKAFEFIEPNWLYSTYGSVPTDPLYTNGKQWGLLGPPGLSASNAWTTDRAGSSKAIVGVIDAMPRLAEQELASAVRENFIERNPGSDDDGNHILDDLFGIAVVGHQEYGLKKLSDAEPFATIDHGTQVASIACARANNIMMVGVAPSSQFVPAGCSLVNGGYFDAASLIIALDYMSAMRQMFELNSGMGAPIVAVNCSWGSTETDEIQNIQIGESQTLKEAIIRCNLAGVICVLAAGNENLNLNTNNLFPAAYGGIGKLDCIVTVGAITERGNRWIESDQLGSCFGLNRVHLYAPGHDIVTLSPNWNSEPRMLKVPMFRSDGQPSFSKGTSMAAPHVTGAIAIWAGEYRKQNGKLPSIAAIKEALKAAVQPDASLECIWGGRLDLSKWYPAPPHDLVSIVRSLTAHN